MVRRAAIVLVAAGLVVFATAVVPAGPGAAAERGPGDGVGERVVLTQLAERPAVRPVKPEPWFPFILVMALCVAGLVAMRASGRWTAPPVRLADRPRWSPIVGRAPPRGA